MLGTSMLRIGSLDESLGSGANSSTLYVFTFLYVCNIATSNLSLGMAVIPFHQLVRAATPVFTVVIEYTAFDVRHTSLVYLTLAPVMIGVMLVTSGEYRSSKTGAMITLFSALLASIKTILTGRMLRRVNSLELLHRTSGPACLIGLAMALFTGELTIALDRASSLNSWSMVEILFNGSLAFGLNMASFAANRAAGALGMTVAANLKQVLVVVFGQDSLAEGLGMRREVGAALALGGGIMFGCAKYAQETSSERSP